VRQVLEARDRTAGGVTAPPFGLYLVDVQYPAEFNLPRVEPGPLLVPLPLGGIRDSGLGTNRQDSRFGQL
jgi:tRNA pseudouridine38-40 synthase